MPTSLKPTVLLLCGLLAACADNPLRHKSTHDAARLIADASLVAMKQLNPKMRNKSDRYRKCMEHHEDKGFNCDALYKAMCEDLRSQGLHVTPSDLKDQAFFGMLADELQQLSYYSL